MVRGSRNITIALIYLRRNVTRIGKILKVFDFLGVDVVISILLTPRWQIFYAMGQIFIVANGPINEQII